MKSKSKHKEALKFTELRNGVLAAIAEMDLKGADSRVTRAMCIVEESFDAAVKGRKLIPQRIFALGIAKAKSIA
jgi:hypothetical protein